MTLEQTPWVAVYRDPDTGTEEATHILDGNDVRWSLCRRYVGMGSWHSGDAVGEEVTCADCRARWQNGEGRETPVADWGYR
jgi:hypothetical protein